jgi:hypothetical protein
VLFTFFFLLSLILYIKFIISKNKSFYIISLLLFLCSLLSKGSAVSLSLCVVAIDYLYQRNLLSKKIVIEKIPFFILSIAFGIITISTQGHNNIILTKPFYEQIACASFGFVSYIYNLILPVNLIALYPYPKEVSIIHWSSLIISLLFVTGIIVYLKTISRIVLFAILFFIINIMFLLQIIPD